MFVSSRNLRAAVSNVAGKVLYGHVADLRPMPAEAVGAGPLRSSVYRYRGPEGVVPAGPPVLFVPPPAAPARCYDLRRGCSLAEHVVSAGRRSYLLDHGPDGPAATARDGAPEWIEECVEGWIGEVLPEAVRTVSRDASGQPVQLVGWCLGGLFALLAAAVDPGLPVASVAMVGTPSRMDGPEVATARSVIGRLVAPAARLKREYRTLANIDSTEYLAQDEAFDHFHALAGAAPGRPVREVYSALLGDRETAARGEIAVGGRRIPLGAVRVPVLAVAGRSDKLAPVSAVHPFTRLLHGAPEVRFEAVPGGHLGALTGLAARTTTWARLDRWLDEGIVRHGIRPHRRAAAAGL
ncbi:alpha/beta hydrolase [Actinomadura vinacea]|uniref:Alpha/beta hydrolase n=1 Tax=Actinomadura vinacea TaxID=115336 RepID=A0ABN3IUJ5_9ACTN